jgi:hypothetical protein
MFKGGDKCNAEDTEEIRRAISLDPYKREESYGKKRMKPTFVRVSEQHYGHTCI